MTALPTGRQGSLLALGLTLLLLACLWVGVAAPLLDWYADGAETLQQRRGLARRMSELVETLPALRRQIEDSATGAPPPAAVLAGGSDAIAGARLQELVQAMAREAGIGLNRVETLPVEQRGGYIRIGLHVAFAADWPAVIHLLQAIGEASPRMLVDDLQLRSNGIRTSGATAEVDAGLSVFAFRAAGATAEAPGR